MIYLGKEELDKWELSDLRDLKRELHWTIQSKENKAKVVVWQIEEYEGVSKAFLNFDNALCYVKENIEKAYQRAHKEYTEEGYPSYITLSGFAPRIVPKLYLPDDVDQLDSWFVLDKEVVVK
jgi:hypothetical protein